MAQYLVFGLHAGVRRGPLLFLSVKVHAGVLILNTDTGKCRSQSACPPSFGERNGCGRDNKVWFVVSVRQLDRESQLPALCSFMPFTVRRSSENRSTHTPRGLLPEG